MNWCLFLCAVGLLVWIAPQGRDIKVRSTLSELGRMTLQFALFWLIYLLATGRAGALRIG